jgi:3-hydroxyisobutyrate dehydrogenase
MVNQICIAGLVQGLSAGANFGMQAATLVKGELDFGFVVDWMRKDFGIYLEKVNSNGARLPVTALVDQLYTTLQARGGKRWDTSALIHLLMND